MLSRFKKIVAAGLAFCVLQDPAALRAMGTQSFSIPWKEGSISSALTSQALGAMALSFTQRLRDQLSTTPFFTRFLPAGSMGISPSIVMDEDLTGGLSSQAASPNLLMTPLERAREKRIERVEVAIGSLYHGKSRICDIGVGAKALSYTMALFDLAERQKSMPDEVVKSIFDAIQPLQRAEEIRLEIEETYKRLMGKPLPDRTLEILEWDSKTSEERTRLLEKLGIRPDQFEAKPLSLHEAEINIHRFEELLMHYERARVLLETAIPEFESHFQATDDREKAYANSLLESLKFVRSNAAIVKSRLNLAIGMSSSDTQTVGAILTDIQALYPEKKNLIEFINHTDADATLSGDRTSLISAVVNLIDNALYFSEDYQKEKAKVQITLTRDQNGILILKISDNGKGVPPEYLAKDPTRGRIRLFQLFNSARKGGTGLGTTEAWYAIHDVGGRIDVHSEFGNGTTITVRLPTSNPVYLSQPLLPDPRTADLQRAAQSQADWLSRLHTELYPILVQNMISVIQRRVSTYPLDKLRRTARELLQNSENDDFVLKHGEGINDVLAQRASWLTPENVATVIDPLNEKDPSLLARYWKTIWTWEVLARLSHEDPIMTDQQGILKIWLEKFATAWDQRAEVRQMKLPYRLPAEFALDVHGIEFTEEELEQQLFSWTLVNLRLLNLPDRLIRYFRRDRGTLREDLTFSVNGVLFGPGRRRLSPGDVVQIVQRPAGTPSAGAPSPSSTGMGVPLFTLLFQWLNPEWAHFEPSRRNAAPGRATLPGIRWWQRWTGAPVLDWFIRTLWVPVVEPHERYGWAAVPAQSPRQFAEAHWIVFDDFIKDWRMATPWDWRRIEKATELGDAAFTAAYVKTLWWFSRLGRFAHYLAYLVGLSAAARIQMRLEKKQVQRGQRMRQDSRLTSLLSPSRATKPPGPAPFIIWVLATLALIGAGFALYHVLQSWPSWIDFDKGAAVSQMPHSQAFAPLALLFSKPHKRFWHHVMRMTAPANAHGGPEILAWAA